MNINAANAISHANPKTPTITRTARLFAIAETNSGKNGNAAVKTSIYFASTLGKAIAIKAKQRITQSDPSPARKEQKNKYDAGNSAHPYFRRIKT